MKLALLLLAAALAGALGVYLYFATRPAALEQSRYVYPLGARVELVSAAGARPRVLLAFGALLACLIFLAGSLSTLFA